MQFINYDRTRAVEYAKKYALTRNSKYYDFSLLGGDCTNFCSQCLYEGIKIMNYEKTFGWYYNSVQERSPSWAGVSFFYNFLVKNLGVVNGNDYTSFSNAIGDGSGPFAREVEMSGLEIGDFIQLGNSIKFYHTLIVVGFNGEQPLVATHTSDVLFRRLDSYVFNQMRCIKILGGRK